MRSYSAVVAHQSLRDGIHLIKAQKKKVSHWAFDGFCDF